MKITTGVKKMQIDDDDLTTVVSSSDDTASLNSDDDGNSNVDDVVKHEADTGWFLTFSWASLE